MHTMRLDPDEFRARPLRVHALLHDISLEDAWAFPLSVGGAGRTVQDVRAVMLAGRETAPVPWNLYVTDSAGADSVRIQPSPPIRKSLLSNVLSEKSEELLTSRNS